MALFRRNAGSFVGTEHRWRVMQALSPDAEKTGTFTIPQGAGTVSVTGLGFQPDVVILMSNLGGQRFFIGCGTGASADEQWSMAWAVGQLATRWRYTVWEPGKIACGIKGTTDAYGVPVPGTIMLDATLDSLDSDGFTLDVAIQTEATDRSVGYIAMQGNFHAGIISTDEGINDLPFEPTGLWLATCQGNGDLIGQRYGIYAAQGMASKIAVSDVEPVAASPYKQYGFWSGGRPLPDAGFVHYQTTSRWSPDELLTWGEGQLLDSPSRLYTTYELWGRVRVATWGSNSIGLDWSDIDFSKPLPDFGYLAVGVPSDVSRWDWDWHSAYNYVDQAGPGVQTIFVMPTVEDRPTAFIGFSPIYDADASAQHDGDLGLGLMRGWGYNFTFGTEDPNLGRWATSTWSGDSVPPPLGNDAEPKEDEYYGGVGEARGSSASFIQDGASAFGRLTSFGHFNMGGSGSFLDPYSVGYGSRADFVHWEPGKKHLLPILHVGP